MNPVLARLFSPQHGPIVLAVVLALGLLYGPTLHDLINGAWTADSQGHGPVVLAVSLWLLWKRWPAPEVGNPSDGQTAGWITMVLGLVVYALGRSQGIMTMETGSLVILVIALVLLFRGRAVLRVVWFPLLFMAFMVPLPGGLVDAVTQPMKLAVSYVAEVVLHSVGYPISRTGVILYVGQYQLLVADACAGLHTLFTLEALGLLYLNLVTTASWGRNIALAILIVPISFAANVIRVMVLTLITYHFGDEAGQGFLHGFAGMVLFMSALALTISADSMLRWLFPSFAREKAA